MMIAALFALAAASSSPAPLQRLFDDEWERWMKENPLWASRLGDRRYNDQWQDMSLAAIEKRAQGDAAALAALAKIDRATLSEGDKLDAALFEDVLATRVELHKHRMWLAVVDQISGVHGQDRLVDSLRFDTIKDYDDWLARMRAFPALVDQNIALVELSIAEKRAPPRAILERVPAQIKAQIVDDPTKSSFWRPFAKMPSSFSAADKKRLETAARAEIAKSIVPSMRRFLDVVETKLIPAASTDVAITARTGGADAYKFLVKMHTTTNMTPDEIHALGLKEVARIEAEMQGVMKRVGFKGTLKEFFVELRTNPRHYFTSGDQILERSRAIAKWIDGRLPKVLKTMPRSPYGVEPIPDAVAPDSTTAYYSAPAADGSRAGTYFVNLYRPEMRPKWEMIPLCLHEAAPGHHTQIALGQERPEVPMFRRHAAPYTAFWEGWGLYAESLGEEMGLYDDPYDKMGQLAYEMWRAVRLVVDTGMHAKGWSRTRAIDYFLAHAPKTELDVTNEVDRYIIWPGQALAYKIGQLKIKELRARAQKQLGDKFNLGAFHDVVLLDGALPLSLLEKRVDAWIARTR